MMKKKEKNEIEETVERCCAFCEFATALPTPDGEDSDMICEKRGVVRADHVCGKFRYDLLKRAPREKPSMPQLVPVALDE